jgi:hypothetical protein
MMVLGASASYMACLRRCAGRPPADARVNVSLSIAITFPVNVVFGIPL